MKLLAEDESSKHPRKEWHDRDITRADSYWEHIDPSASLSTYHFRVFLLLRDVLQKSEATLGDVKYFEDKLRHYAYDQPPAWLAPVRGDWRQRVLAMSKSVDVVSLEFICRRLVFQV